MEQEILGQSLRTWLVAGGISLASYLILEVVRGVVIGRLARIAKRTVTFWDDLTMEALGRTRRLFLVAVAAYAGATVLSLPERGRNALTILVTMAVVLQAGLWANGALGFLLDRYRRQKLEADRAGAGMIDALGFLLRGLLWSGVMLLALDNLGVDVTALVAGLGVGGIAIALALQRILGDLFASLAIVLDKPFVLGDFIIVGEQMGVVEQVGLKTTRVRSLWGEQVIFSNEDLLQSRVRNFGRMQERRVVFAVGVTYQTPRDKLERIPAIIREVIASQPKARFDRSHFQRFGDSSLDFETVYYLLTPEYNVYMDIQQAINLDLYRRFEEAEIDFAYPTRTVYLTGAEPVPPRQQEPVS